MPHLWTCQECRLSGYTVAAALADQVVSVEPVSLEACSSPVRVGSPKLNSFQDMLLDKLSLGVFKTILNSHDLVFWVPTLPGAECRCFLVLMAGPRGRWDPQHHGCQSACRAYSSCHSSLSALCLRQTLSPILLDVSKPPSAPSLLIVYLIWPGAS